jgi:hypothetical protein
VRLRGTKRVLALLTLAAGLLLSSCGSSAHKPSATRTSTLSSVSPALTRPSPTHTAPAHPPVGATQRVGATGTTLVVRVAKVIDPLLASGARLAAGMKAVGVVIDVRNAGPGGYDSSATSDFSLLTATGHAMAVYAPKGVCQTYIQDFMNELGPGQARTGCIAYAVPAGKAPTLVRLAPDGGTAHQSASWVVP